jgi:hypothetical protein
VDSRNARKAIELIDACLASLPKLDWSRGQREVEDLLLDTRALAQEFELLNEIEADIARLKRRRFP